MKCDVCGQREQTLGGFISGEVGNTSITRTCDECWKLTPDEAMTLQQKTRSCITFADEKV